MEHKQGHPTGIKQELDTILAAIVAEIDPVSIYLF
jgi:hypothetical protein